MTPLLILLVVVAVVAVAVGLQVTANQIQRHPVDTRNAGTLIDTIRRSSLTVRPTELDRLTAVVEESLTSEAVCRSRLVPLLDDLRRRAPGPGGPIARPAGRGRRSRSRWLAAELADLEERWGTRSPRAPG